MTDETEEVDDFRLRRGVVGNIVIVPIRVVELEEEEKEEEEEEVKYRLNSITPLPPEGGR